MRLPGLVSFDIIHVVEKHGARASKSRRVGQKDMTAHCDSVPSEELLKRVRIRSRVLPNVSGKNSCWARHTTRASNSPQPTLWAATVFAVIRPEPSLNQKLGQTALTRR